MSENLWFYAEGDLFLIFGNNFTWESIGFNPAQLFELNKIGYQLPNEEGVSVSLYPIAYPAAFWSTIGPKIKNNPKYKVISKEEAEKIHSKLLLLAQEQRILEFTTPTKEDSYQAALLLAIMEIKNALIKEENSND